jgi:hypothetical protein
LALVSIYEPILLPCLNSIIYFYIYLRGYELETYDEDNIVFVNDIRFSAKLATTVTLNNNISIESRSKMLGHKNLHTSHSYDKILDNLYFDYKPTTKIISCLNGNFSIQFSDDLSRKT